MRSGEKLFEELSLDNNIKKTVHPKIMAIKEKFDDKNDILNLLSRFKEKYPENVENTIKIIKSVVKDYKPIPVLVDHFSSK